MDDIVIIVIILIFFYWYFIIRSNEKCIVFTTEFDKVKEIRKNINNLEEKNKSI